MTSHARSRPSGRSLIAQGEPMVWLTGGMFAIAITMIVALVCLILYQGLATLWPRPYVLFKLDSGKFVSGEWIDTTPYRLTTTSLSKFPAPSQAKAKELLGEKESVNSDQFYLRTGNYDVINRHFDYVPTVTVQNREPNYPPDIWTVERLEWGVLYGFPLEFVSKFSPDMDAGYEKQRAFLEQIDRFRPSDEASIPNFEKLVLVLREQLESQASKLNEEYRKADGGVPERVVDRKQLSKVVADSYYRMARIQRELGHAQHELGEIDRRIAESRINVRKAELREGTELLVRLDEGLEIANSLGAIRQQWEELEGGWQALQRTVPKESGLQSEVDRITKSVQAESELESKAWSDKLENWDKEFVSPLPARSSASVKAAIDRGTLGGGQQLVLNEEIARLDTIRGSEQVLFALPVIGEGSPDASAKADNQQSSGIVRLEADGKSATYAWRESPDGATKNLVTKSVAVADMVRWFEPNNLSLFAKLQIYASRWGEFLFGVPREAGVEGGFFPAIWGTIVMTLLMSIAVMPFGVMAALYMREYAKSGWILSLIRISINNLAGVPSIVYGVFGLAFFCYTVGGYIDGGPQKAGFEPWPPVTWFATCAITVIAGTCAFFFAFLGSGSPAQMTPLRKRVASFAGLFWVLSLIGFVALIAKIPFFDGFYQASLPNPTFGKGCLLWASCTLALLTLPVVIVATEEALAAVPNSLREGSYACGAGKWQTLQRIVLPYARPGIITGFILSMARGAGEVAPMMLVGAIPLATELPLDLEFPFFHGSRSFMHLGFQIFSLGFQSQNSEAAKPMVFTATLLLLSIVTFLNVAAIWLRARLRKRFQSSQF